MSRPVKPLRLIAVCAAIGLLAFCLGIDCAGLPTTGFPPTTGTPQNPQSPNFPKTAVWTIRRINNDASMRPVAIRTADLDADTRLDVVAAYAGLDTVQPGVFIFFQDDTDTFTPVQVLVESNLAGVSSIAVSDLNADSRPDIVAAADARLVLMISPADPRQSEGWNAFVIGNSEGADIGPWMDVAIGNIDGAAGPDLVACGQSPGRLAWFASPSANPSSGAGWTRVDIDAATRTGAAGVALLDVNGDGRTDVISTASDEEEARVAWYANPTDPGLNPWTRLAVGNLPNATRLIVADLNTDGRPDVVTTNPDGRQIGWYVHPADPTAATAWSGFLIAQFTAATPNDVGAADIDGNGQLDVVAATQQPGALRWFTPTGAVTDVWTENNLRNTSGSVTQLALGDIDADGRPDVAATLQAADPNQDSIEWFENPEP